jgi:hypothetical protein
MFVFGLGILALFSVLSAVLGNEDPRRKTDPRDELYFWTHLGVR